MIVGPVFSIAAERVAVSVARSAAVGTTCIRCASASAICGVGSRPHNTGEVWECPDFFPLGDKHVLIVSTMLRTLYFAGRYEDRRFYPEMGGCCDFGHVLRRHQPGRRAWRAHSVGLGPETRSTTAQGRAGWGSAISLPRVLSLAPNGTLRYTLPKEVESLRGEHFTDLEKMSGDSLEINAEIDPAGAAECGLAVRRSHDGAEQTRDPVPARRPRAW